MKNLNLLIYLLSLFLFKTNHSLAQYIGVRYQNAQSIKDEYQYSIFDFNGNIKFELEPNVLPWSSSFLIKKYDFESNEWSITVNERWIKNDNSFFVTDTSQTILPLSTPDSTYIMDFSGNIVKSFGKKYEYLSQPNENTFIGYRKLANEWAFMLTFIDHKGEELFNGKEFWEATLFSEGMAVVQEDNEGSDWKVINRSGDEILNLSKLFNKKIIKAYPFVNGFANVIVRREINEIEAISKRIENNNDSLQFYLEIPLNSSSDEMRVGNILYRVSKTGEIQMLDWHSSIYNDIYYRRHYRGEDYHKAINKNNKLDGLVKIDSLLTLSGKYFIANDKFGSVNLINNEGDMLTFPKRYVPIKCSENLVLGKRGKNYVLYNPENSMSIYFKDKTPIHFKDLLSISEDEPVKHLEEFILIRDRILKIGITGPTSLLDMDGNLLYDFDTSEFDASLNQTTREFMQQYNCPDKIDFDEIKTEKIEHLNISCDVIDFKDIMEVRNLKMLAISDVKKIINSNLLTDMLNNNVDVSITGDIKFEDLGIDLSKILKGSLYINENVIKSKN